MPSESKISVSLEFDTATAIAVCGMLCGVLLWVRCLFTIVWQATLDVCVSFESLGWEDRVGKDDVKKIIEPQFVTVLSLSTSDLHRFM